VEVVEEDEWSESGSKATRVGACFGGVKWEGTCERAGEGEVVEGEEKVGDGLFFSPPTLTRCNPRVRFPQFGYPRPRPT
jgi:hypothetical protein